MMRLTSIVLCALAASVVAILVTPVMGSAFAADAQSDKSALTVPKEGAAPSGALAPDSPKGASQGQDSTDVAGRGQLEEMMSVCGVSPPCPSGCAVDAVSHKCTEWPAP